ncbi:phosphoribosylanthranilate isomerase [Salegentibacter salegens]|uniref:N-(5'-phosphoribosyl)anthranilate isomerase n=1 Tax=Salegentibacter salegens TaxID=143223 RepID=A0A1M7NVF7_9FLAO|nr:phosphoribosylanthranilate isomerase [Salegentibacter salegens]PRX45774.1 phosphoribosylanthranilate isomerase [Salegentibacter salegens]SHN07955.1 phosphoribosylanthranilate isomerase [Salegentibacter salegens]
MKNLKLKICGMKHPENISEVAKLQPDYMGFIFYEKTPRNFDAEIPEISLAIKKTGVFVNEEIDLILEKIKKHDLNAIQLHGDESAAFCAELKTLLIETEVEIIKVFSVKDDFDFERLEEYEAVVDYFLFDTKGKNKGGNGITFNWEILKEYPSEKPFFLSGGIGPEEVEAIKKLKAYFEENGKGNLLYAIDVNSKFEEEAGFKNVDKLKEFRKRF